MRFEDRGRVLLLGFFIRDGDDPPRPVTLREAIEFLIDRYRYRRLREMKKKYNL